jgi:hypothetical protein
MTKQKKNRLEKIESASWDSLKGVNGLKVKQLGVKFNLWKKQYLSQI